MHKMFSLHYILNIKNSAKGVDDDSWYTTWDEDQNSVRWLCISCTLEFKVTRGDMENKLPPGNCNTPPPPSSHTQISDITRLFTEKVHPPRYRYRYLTSVLRFRNGSQPQEKTKIHDLIPRVNTVIRTRVRKVIRIFLDLERKNYVYVRKFQLI